VHLGRTPRSAIFREQLFAQTPDWLPPALGDVETFLSPCDGKRRRHMLHTARTRVIAALRGRARQEDVVLKRR
jgi:hypothetical protein